MKIGIVGATGKQGNLLLLEAYRRGHQVTALIRNQEKLTHEVPFIEKELYGLTAKEVEHFDVIISAFNAPTHMPQLHQTALRHLTKILNHSDTRLYVVGGAGSLWTDSAKEERLFETTDFPEDFFATASSMAQSLQELIESKATNWTYVSPAIDFDVTGELTSDYILADDILTYNEQNKSHISYKDYAKAMLDIIESKKYLNEHLSVLSK